MTNPMKLPPQSGKDEQALLGALLDDNRRYNLIAMLSADDFADPIHALIP
jgi:replicative DNA helicase